MEFVDDLQFRYGRIRDIDIKTPARPPAFAFVTFDDHRDADAAIRGRDGYNYDGYRLRVEFAKGLLVPRIAFPSLPLTHNLQVAALTIAALVVVLVRVAPVEAVVAVAPTMVWW